MNELFALDRPWDKSTRAVVYELPDVISPAGWFILRIRFISFIYFFLILELKSRNLPGFDSHSPQAFQPNVN